MKIRFPVLIFLMVFSIAADGLNWQLVETQFVNDVLGEGGRPPYEAIIAPDGSALAWGIRGREGGLCIYTFADATKTCTPWPEDYDRSGTDLVWSADSQFLAFTENFFLNFREPDLWTFEVSTSSFANRTQDNETDTIIDEAFDGLVDYLPFWNPADNGLYFFRSEKLADSYTLTLMRLNGEMAEMVRDLTSDLPQFGIFRRPAIDPGGQYIALPVAGRENRDPLNGVWLLNLENGDLNQIIRYDDFSEVVPEWVEKDVPVNIEHVQWAGSQGLVVFLYSGAFEATYGLINYYYFDLATEKLTPLFDFSGLNEPADMFQLDSEGQTPFSHFPRVGVVAPDGSAFFYVHYAEPRAEVRVSALPLPPGISEPQQIGFMETSQGLPDPHPSMAQNGTAYMFAYVMKFERQ